MKGLRFIGKNPTVVLKTRKFDVPKVIRYIVLYELKLKNLIFAIGTDHFLDARNIKIEARNYVVVTSLQW